MNNRHALILDDEPDIRELLGLTLSRMGIDYQLASNLSEAYSLLKKHSFDLCLTDMRLPDGEGIDLVHHIQQEHPQLPVAVITAFGSTQLAVESLKAGAFDFISKPVDLEKLRELITSAIKLDQQSANDTPQQSSLLGESMPMQKVRAMIQKLARSQAPILIQGESGTGKELAARQIHNLSPRADKPFIAINCGAIPSELMESEFFGHKKGSFTSAHQDKQGLFQAAHGGTLFLDEIAELPQTMQVKLLRAIQERAIRPVGDRQELGIDVRILSATNKNLKSAVETGQFRDDLFFRLNVIELLLPPLRDRGNDIGQLALHILTKLDDQLQLSSTAIQTLQGYSFPGNIRELENIMERAAALSENNIITENDLHLMAISSSDSQPHSRQEPLPSFLEKIEYNEIINALDKHRWNRAEAADELGISTRQLRYRMEKLKIFAEK